MILTINNIYRETLNQLSEAENLLNSESVSKLRNSLSILNNRGDANEMAQIHNALVNLNGIISRSNNVISVSTEADF